MFRWQEWGGRTCARSVNLMVGDLSARGMLCGVPDGRMDTLYSMGRAVVFSIGPANDTAAALDTASSQHFKAWPQLAGNPNLFIDCRRVVALVLRAERFLAGYTQQAVNRTSPELPEVLRLQQLPQDGGDEQLSLFDELVETVTERRASDDQINRWREMRNGVMSGAANSLSAALDGAGSSLRFEVRSLQYLYSREQQAEDLTRRPVEIKVNLVEWDRRIAYVTGDPWMKLLVPTAGQKGGLVMTFATWWRGGPEPCTVVAYMSGASSSSGRLACTAFRGEEGKALVARLVTEASRSGEAGVRGN
jgi:hypothetical protein